MPDQKLEIVVAARDLASGVLKGVASNLTRDINQVEGSSKGLATASTQMARRHRLWLRQDEGLRCHYRAELGLTSIAMAGIAGAGSLWAEGSGRCRHE